MLLEGELNGLCKLSAYVSPNSWYVVQYIRVTSPMEVIIEGGYRLMRVELRLPYATLSMVTCRSHLVALNPTPTLEMLWQPPWWAANHWKHLWTYPVIVKPHRRVTPLPRMNQVFAPGSGVSHFTHYPMEMLQGWIITLCYQLKKII